MDGKRIKKANEKIAQTVVEGYQKIENSVVGGYKKIEGSVVGSFNRMTDKIVGSFLAREGETVEEAKTRMHTEAWGKTQK